MVFFSEEPQSFIVLGTFDIITGRMATMKDLEKEDEAKTAGYFFLKFENGNQTMLNFYDFMSFTHINGTLEAREIVNARRINDSTGEKERQKVLTSYFHLTHPTAFKFNQNFILSTEVYKSYCVSQHRWPFVTAESVLESPD